MVQHLMVKIDAGGWGTFLGMLVTVLRDVQLLLQVAGKTIKHDLKTEPRGIPIINWSLDFCLPR